MSGYAAQVPVADRWAIAAYVRTLQLSRDDAGRVPLGPRPAELEKAPPALGRPDGRRPCRPGGPSR